MSMHEATREDGCFSASRKHLLQGENLVFISQLMKRAENRGYWINLGLKLVPKAHTPRVRVRTSMNVDLFCISPGAHQPSFLFLLFLTPGLCS